VTATIDYLDVKEIELLKLASLPASSSKSSSKAENVILKMSLTTINGVALN